MTATKKGRKWSAETKARVPAQRALKKQPKDETPVEHAFPLAAIPARESRPRKITKEAEQRIAFELGLAMALARLFQSIIDSGKTK